MSEGLPDFANFYRTGCRFDTLLGLELSVEGPGQIQYRLPVHEQHLSMPGACHGGVLAAMMDAVLGLTALSQVYSAGQLCQTVEFKINYLANPEPGDVLLGRGCLESQGKRIVVTSASLMHASTERIYATGLGTFSVYPLTKRVAQLGLSGDAG